MEAKKDLNWVNVDTDTMNDKLKAKYAALKKAQAASAEAKVSFEIAFLEAAKKAERIDADIELAFGYRFGKLAIAKVDKATVKPKASTKPKFTF